MLPLKDCNEELEFFVLSAINPNHSAFFQREARFATLSLEVVDAEVLKVAEVLLCRGAVIP